ncbi:MAG: hypothetical protein JW751_23875, partial [Polyangiaceae bacterium]|nr:hypothetical protein [Polyangiaceae bacterium]
MEPRWITAICWSLLAAACTVQYTERDDANSYGCEATDSCWWQDSGDDDGVTPGDDSDDVEFCRDDGDCSAGRVCVGWGDCVDIVEDCPLTEECLADPPATEAPPEWLGIDPAFSGVLGDGDDPRRISVELDFYPDHLYGEGTIFDLLADTASDVIITGTRSGASLEGQIVAIGGGRSFDATFAGRLLSASRISGTFTWSDDHGVREGTLEWYRTSPCGCLAGVCETDRDCGDGEHCTNERCQPDPECDDDRDCADGEACEAGSCAAVPGCERDRDCADGEICEAGTCEAMPECEATDDCVATDCYFDSDCGEGMICEAGSCEAAPPCLNDADCGEGMVCEAGSCEAAPPCFDDSDCGEGMICEA